MALKKETKDIGGDTYEASQFPAPKGMALLEWLMQKVGPGLEAMFDDDGKTNDANGVFKGVGRILKQLSGKDLQYLYDQFADSCTVGGVLMNKENIKMFHFAGRYGELFQWMLWMLNVNYESFFAEMGTLKGNVEETQTLPVSPSQEG